MIINITKEGNISNSEMAKLSALPASEFKDTFNSELKFVASKTPQIFSHKSDGTYINRVIIQDHHIDLIYVKYRD
jgi:hypothetical protein